METYLRNLKQSQLNEVSRLQARAQDQANTFDLLRNFVKRRIEIEEVYARSLEKLAKSFSVPNQSECNKLLDILFQQTEKEAQTRIEMTGSWNFQVMSRLEDLEKEKRSMIGHWKRREKQIQKVFLGFPLCISKKT